jgi:hypothetical protein
MVSSPPGTHTMPFLVIGGENVSSWIVFSVALEAQETIPIQPMNPINWRKLIIAVSYTD